MSLDSFKYSNERKIYLPSQEPEKKSVDLSEVKQIVGQEGQELGLDNISEHIEEPLIEPVRRCFLKGLPTVTSSANGENNGKDGIGVEAYLALNFNDLSKTNKEIAIKLASNNSDIEIITNYRGTGKVLLQINLTSEDNLPLATSRVENYFNNIIDCFQKQERVVQTLKMTEIEEYLASLLGYSCVEKMRENHSKEQVDEFVEDIKTGFDWSENPLIGKKKSNQSV